MCGIAGFVAPFTDLKERRRIVEQMCDSIHHRGPDDRGYYVTEEVALGHCRLSIIDLTTGGQPMFNEDSTIAIVFNGEIYNFLELKEELKQDGHRFATSSDTEVIIHLYEQCGERCVERLNGMFAFAIWDGRQRRLFAARDRIGQKPLYFTYGPDHFIFASELKALLKHPIVPRRLSLPSLARYLVYEYVPAPDTIFSGIYKLEPACSLTFDQGKVKVVRYWDYPPGESLDLSLNEYERRLTALLHEAVGRHLVSNVPLGVFLSGGIDSSCVVAMMSEFMPAKDIHTFSIGFRERSFDESSHARAVAEYFGTTHHEEILSARTMLDIFPQVVAFLDEPLGDASIIPTYLLSRFTRQYVTVALGGDGGDELLAGYPTFLAHVLAEYYNCLPGSVRRLMESLVKRLPVSMNNISFDFKARRFLSGAAFDPYIRQQVWIGSFTHLELPQILTTEVQRQCDLQNIYYPIERHLKDLKGSPLEKILYLYTRLYLQDDILVKVDRASMATSLETRAPFLDVELIEFLTRLPLDLKLHGFTSKYLLKRVLRKRLPHSILKRPKKGFGIPVAHWLREEIKPLALELFARKKIASQGLFQYPYIEKLLQEHFQGKKDNRKVLWTLMIFEMWFSKYAQPSAPEPTVFCNNL